MCSIRINLAQGTVWWLATVKMVMNLRVPKCRKFLDNMSVLLVFQVRLCVLKYWVIKFSCLGHYFIMCVEMCS